MDVRHDGFDLAVRGGTVVTADASFAADIGVRAGRIAQIGGEVRAEREIDAAAKLVLPGGVDPHVHLSLPEPPGDDPRWCDDFHSGTRAAAAGGITTAGNMTFAHPGQTLLEAVERDAAAVEQDAVVDVVLHPVYEDPATQPLADIPTLASRGTSTLKFFMSFGGFATQPDAFLDAMRLTRQAGLLTMIHAEDAAMIAHATRRLMADGRGAIANYAESRPVAAEVSATARAIAFAETTGAPIYLVHLSSASALDEARRGRARGVRVAVETRPLYLHLTEERFAEPDGAKYVGQPPLRTSADRAALWIGLATGEIDTVGSDHAPWRYADKVVPGLDVTTIRPGVADLDTMLPMLFSEGVTKGRLSIHRFVAVAATNAAKLLGLFPHKGTIAVGADADLVVWDPLLTKSVRAADCRTNADYSPYEGWEVTGWPVITVSRGEVVFERGEVLGTRGRGRILRRPSDV